MYFVAALHCGRVDLAISTQTGGYYDSVVAEQLGSEPWGVAGRIGHSILTNAQSLVQLEDADWILGRNTELLDEAIEEAFAACETSRPRPGVMTTSVLFVLTALSQTDLLSILPRSVCESHPSLIWRDLSGGAWSSPVFLMRRRHSHLTLGARRLLEALQTTMHELD